MKKVLIFIIFTFLLTGCDVTYNLHLNEKSLSEDVMVTENNKEMYSYTISDMSMVDYNDYYLVKEVPLHYDDPFSPEEFFRIDNVSYYNVDDLTNESRIGIRFKGQFDISDYNRSNLLWKGVKNKKVYESDGSLVMSASHFKMFDEYKNLDKLTINLTSKYKVLKNNADSVNKNVYTWIITRDNYNDKSIYFSCKLDDKINFRFNLKNKPMVIFDIVLLIVIILGVLIYLLIRRRYLKFNSL